MQEKEEIMFNYFNPNSMSFNNFSNNNCQYVLDAAKKGTELLGKNIDYSTLSIWQRYVQSIMSLISKSSTTNYFNLYLQFNMSILMFSPYEQVKRTIEFLIDIAKYV